MQAFCGSGKHSTDQRGRLSLGSDRPLVMIPVVIGLSWAEGRMRQQAYLHLYISAYKWPAHSSQRGDCSGLLLLMDIKEADARTTRTVAWIWSGREIFCCHCIHTIDHLGSGSAPSCLCESVSVCCDT